MHETTHKTAMGQVIPFFVECMLFLIQIKSILI